jgi:hypothetical protein
MQTILSSLIILIAALYIAKQWMPHQLKQRLLQMFGKNLAEKSNAANACSSCSSCGSCGSGEEKNITSSTKKMVFTRSK